MVAAEYRACRMGHSGFQHYLKQGQCRQYEALFGRDAHPLILSLSAFNAAN